MSDKYKDQAAFYIVYLREAHPADSASKQAQKSGGSAKGGGGSSGKGGSKGGGGGGNIAVNQPTTYEEREKVASSCKTGLDLKIPFVIDTIENTVDGLYAGMPDRIYIINKEGKIHYKGGVGPFGFKPDEAEASLKQLMK